MGAEDDLLRTFISEIHYDSDSAARAAESVMHLGFRPVAQAFAANIANAVGLLQLPYRLLMSSHLEAKRLLVFTDVFLPLRLKTGADYGDAEVKRQVDAEVDRRISQEIGTEEFTQELCRASDTRLSHLLRSSDLQRKMRMILLSLISATWTAFEILAGDAWQFALNNRPGQIAQDVLRQLFPSGTAEGLSAKGIPIWMAAKYGFDLREHVGDMLKPRIDFSDIKEIQKAYFAAFGNDAAFEGALDDKSLLVLEATRHLVVHRGGLVDEKYNRISGENFEVNQPIPLDADFLSNILGAGIAAGCALICFLDGWLGKTPPDCRRSG